MKTLEEIKILGLYEMKEAGEGRKLWNNLKWNQVRERSVAFVKSYSSFMSSEKIKGRKDEPNLTLYFCNKMT